MLVAFTLGLGVNQAAAVLSNEDFLPGQQARTASTGQTLGYSVESGDTLWSIANKFNCDVNSLMALNQLNENSLLRIGQEIRIPGTRQPIHIISSGETMWDIAAANGTSVAMLQRLNPDKDANNLEIGDTLVLPQNARSSGLVMSQSSRGLRFSRTIMKWPIIGTITSYFGWRSRGYHYGLDIAGETGEPIYAAAPGVVSYAGWKGGYGKAVVIDHDNGCQTLYGHMSRILVDVGQSISRGDTIGRVGSTGHSTGPHVHFEVRKNGTFCNPLTYLK